VPGDVITCFTAISTGICIWRGGGANQGKTGVRFCEGTAEFKGLHNQGPSPSFIVIGKGHEKEKDRPSHEKTAATVGQLIPGP